MTSVLENSLYLDHHATTPVDPRVIDAMIPYFTKYFGNPSGTETPAGRQAHQAVESARAQVANLINAETNELIFTSGATEANNLALIGVANALRERTSRRCILTTAIEHKAVLESCKALSQRGYETIFLPIASTGRVDLRAANELIDESALIVSVQAANNEIGTIQPIKEIVELAHSHGAIVHCDGAQAVGRVPVDVLALGVDLLSMSAHKFYGPKGVGTLFVRNGPRSFPLHSLSFGGGQEQGIRSGTINVPGVVGMGMAAEVAMKEMSAESMSLKSVRDTFETNLKNLLPEVLINGDATNRLPNNSSVTFPGLDAQALIQHLPGLELSTGSACTSGALEPSYVLEAIGLSRELAYGTLRFGWGRGQTLEDAELAARQVAEAAQHLRTIT